MEAAFKRNIWEKGMIGLNVIKHQIRFLINRLMADRYFIFFLQAFSRVTRVHEGVDLNKITSSRKR